MTNYPCVVHQTDGHMFVSNGSVCVGADTPAKTAHLFPGFVMPDGIIGFNYEKRGGRIFYTRHMADGSLQHLHGQEWEFAESLIAQVDDAKTREPDFEHPLWGITDLGAAKARAVLHVDAMAELVRLRYITAGSGQAMVYQAKIDAASRWENAGSPASAAGFPLIAAEIGISGATPGEVVATWRSLHDQWQSAAADIERVRLTAKNDIEGASDIDAVKLVVDGLIWPE